MTSQVIGHVHQHRYDGVMITTSPSPIGILLREWRERRRMTQLDRSADPVLIALHDEIVTFPAGNPHPSPTADQEIPDFVVPLRLRSQAGVLSFLYTTTVFGTPLDVTLDELAIETFFPADASTVEVFRTLAPTG